MAGLALDFETFERGLVENARLTKETFESIEEFYNQEFEDSDVIDFKTGKISENKGLLQDQSFGVKKFGRLRYGSATQKNNNTILHHIVDSGLGVSQTTWPSNLKDKTSPTSQPSSSVFSQQKQAECVHDENEEEQKPNVFTLKAYQECILTCDEISDGETISSESSCQQDSELTQTDGEPETATTEGSSQKLPSNSTLVETSTENEEVDTPTDPHLDRDTASGHFSDDRLSKYSDVEILSLSSEENAVISISESDPSESEEDYSENVKVSEEKGCKSCKASTGFSVLQIQLDGKVDASSEMLSSLQEKSKEMCEEKQHSNEETRTHVQSKGVSNFNPIRSEGMSRVDKIAKPVPTFYKDEITRGRRFSTAELQETLSPKALVVAKAKHTTQASVVSEQKPCSFKEIFDKIKSSVPAQVKPKIVTKIGNGHSDRRAEWQNCQPNCDIDGNNNSPVKTLPVVTRNKDRNLHVMPEKRYMIEKYLHSTRAMRCDVMVDPSLSDLNISWENSTVITESEYLADNEESTGNSEVCEEGRDRSCTSTLIRMGSRRAGHRGTCDLQNTLKNSNNMEKSSQVKTTISKGSQRKIASSSRSSQCMSKEVKCSNVGHRREAASQVSSILSLFDGTKKEESERKERKNCPKELAVDGSGNFLSQSPGNRNLDCKKRQRRRITTTVQPKSPNRAAESENIKLENLSKDNRGQNQFSQNLIGSPSDIFVKLKHECEKDKPKVSTGKITKNVKLLESQKSQECSLKDCASKTPIAKPFVNMCPRKSSTKKIVEGNQNPGSCVSEESHPKCQSDRNNFSTGKKRFFSPSSVREMFTERDATSSVKKGRSDGLNVEKQRPSTTKMSQHQSPSVIFAEIKKVCQSEENKKAKRKQIAKDSETNNKNEENKAHLQFQNETNTEKNVGRNILTKPLMPANTGKPKKRLDFDKASSWGIVSSTPARGQRTPPNILNISTVSSILPVLNRKEVSGGSKISSFKLPSSGIKSLKTVPGSGDSEKHKCIGKKVPREPTETASVSSANEIKTPNQNVCVKKHKVEGQFVQQDTYKESSNCCNLSVAEKYRAKHSSKKTKAGSSVLGLKKTTEKKGNASCQKSEQFGKLAPSSTEKNVFYFSSSPEILEDDSPEPEKPRFRHQRDDIIFSGSRSIKPSLNETELLIVNNESSDRGDMSVSVAETEVASLKGESSTRSRNSHTPEVRQKSSLSNPKKDLVKTKNVAKNSKNRQNTLNRSCSSKKSTPAAQGKATSSNAGFSRKRCYSSSSEEFERSPKRMKEDENVQGSFNSSSACEGPGKCTKPFCFTCS